MSHREFPAVPGAEPSAWTSTLRRVLGGWFIGFGAFAPLTLILLAIFDWAPVYYFSAEEAQVIGLSQCAEGQGMVTGGSSCVVDWRLPDGTEGEGRIGGSRGDLSIGSTVHVAGDHGYASRGYLIGAAAFSGVLAAAMVLWVFVISPVLCVREFKRARRRARFMP
ncbi:hypothetical protein [Streptomyces johnsoniae]|uniref:DUF3592 domain-containing protein n=1 Tax=Streptomyces johnsoniae TaxID=3075532 RepID=A0ABU2RXH9_9ACTN|nr:hypothetical protein [Streptomyces sp. DSM 41886]MDT0441456.1 hypothetical protein [Streptomyces sp. DSM 41886]